MQSYRLLSLLTAVLFLSFTNYTFSSSSAAETDDQQTATQTHTDADNRTNSLILLIDELNCESLLDHKIRAITSLLNRAIHEQAAPIIVSRNILFNYVARRSYINHPTHPENKFLQDSPFYQGIWRVFKLVGTAYYLLIPYTYLTAKHIRLEPFPRASNPSLGLHFHKTYELSSMLPIHGDFYRDLRTYLRDDTESATIDSIDLSKFFMAPSVSEAAKCNSWIIYMGGHGAPTASTVGTSIASTKKLLDFFDTQLATKFVYINSCFLGGPIKEMLAPKEKRAYKFTLIIGSITDSIVVVHADKMAFKKFFVELSTLPQPATESTLAHACCHLAPCIESKWSSHGVSSLPQVLIGKKFKVLDPHGTVAVLERPPSPHSLRSSVAAGSARDCSSGIEVPETFAPIHPENKIVIPLYQSEYLEPIHISPARCVTKYPAQKTPLSFIPSVGTLLSPELFATAELMHSLFHTATPLLTPFLADDKTAAQNCSAVVEHLSPPEALFPLFVSMLHESGDSATVGSIHHFAEIVALNEIGDVESPFFGLLRFFRDAFLDASHRASKNLFLIDSLTGFNDFVLFEKLSQHSRKIRYPLINPYFLATDDQTITLENVIVITQGQQGWHGNAMHIHISFTFNGRSWQFSFQGTPEEFASKCPWGFVSRPAAAYIEHYQRCTKTSTTEFQYTPRTYAEIAGGAGSRRK